MVISPEKITNFSALQRAPKDDNVIITQYSQKPIEKLGLLKMDFLGLKNLTILDKTKKIILRTKKQKIDLDTIPLDDKRSFSLLAEGKTTGIFQLESAGMRRYLKELKPNNFEDIIAMVSLYRPGPMDWIPDYIAGKHGKKKVKYLHQSLKPILEKTFGIAIYQEQILQIAQIFSGFSLGQADILRRAIGKKIPEELQDQREKFISGAKAKNYSEELAIEIFEKVIEPFAGYGFNKSHAAGYAMIAYQTVFLKANFPTEFMAALLTADRNNIDRIITGIEECRKMKIQVLPPDLNESFANFTVVDEDKIRFGLAAVKGIGIGVINEIISVRNEKNFTSLEDFASRVPAKILNKKSIEALSKSGALQQFGETKQIMENFNEISQFAKNLENQKNQNQNQDSLFGEEVIEKNFEQLQLKEIDPAKKSEILSWERETLGLFVSDHPLSGAKKIFSSRATLANEISKKVGKKVSIGGILSNFRKIFTKTKKTMGILQLEDPTGKIEVILFPKIFQKFSPEFFSQEDCVFWISGRAESRAGIDQIVAEKIETQSLNEIEKLKKEIVEEKPDEKKISKQKKITNQTKKLEKIKIILKKDLQKKDLVALQKILKNSPGENTAEIHFDNKIFPLNFTVCSENLSEKIAAFGDIL